MRVCQVSSFCILIHIVEEVFYSHLGGSVSYGREPQAHFFGWSLYPLSGEVVKYAGCEAERLVENAVYLGELWVRKDPEVCGVVFGFEELFYDEGFVWRAEVASCECFGYDFDVFGDMC